MAQVFVSHASEDLTTAVRVREWLRGDGHTVFLDQDLEAGLGVGDAWRLRLHEELYRADALVCLVSKPFSTSQWCAAEVGIAQAYGVRILPVAIEAGAAHRLLSADTQWADLAVDEERGRAALAEALRRLDAAGGTVWRRSGSPYPGLRAFDAGMARVFFGRSDEARRLAERLRAPAPRGVRLLAVVGPSGCGKSSLVRAGLCPMLEADPDWLVLQPLLPGTDPIGALARSLATAGRAHRLDWTVASVGTAFAQAGGLGGQATELVAAAPPAGRLLVVVDQAEELLTRAGEEVRRRFVALLGDRADGLVRVVATLRPEFLGPVAGLAREAGVAVEPFLLTPLGRDMLPEVITGPARQAGIGVDGELVARLVDDTGSGDALPLLAFTLDRLAHDVGRGGVLSASRYEELGGVHGALATQAESALAAACAATGRTREQVLAGLLRLVTVDDSGEVSRRRVSRGEFADPVWVELGEFVTNRLLVVDSDDGQPNITVAHEKVFTAWQPLAAAISRERDTLRLRRTAELAEAEWNRRGRPADYLWPLGRATDAHDALATSELAPGVRAFLTVSMSRGRRRRNQLTAVLAVLAVAMTGLAFFASAQARSAARERDAVARERDAADEARWRAIAGELVARADGLRATDPATAVRLATAAEAVAAGPRPEAALMDLLVNSGIDANLRGHARAVQSVALSPEGRILATASSDRTVVLWDVSDRIAPRRIGEPLGQSGPVNSAVFSPDGRTLAAGIEDGSVQMWDVSDRAAPRRLGEALAGHAGPVLSVAFSPEGRTLASGSNDRTVVLWEVSDRTAPRRLGAPLDQRGLVDSVVFSPDGRTLAVGSWDATVLLWDVSDRVAPRLLGDLLAGQPGGFVGLAVFSPDGRTLASSGGDRTVELWDLADRASPRRLGEPLAGLSDRVRSVAFSSDGRTLAAGARDGTVVLWDVSDKAAPRRRGESLAGHSGGVESMVFSRDGRTLATASFDGTVVLWDLASRTAASRRVGNPRGISALALLVALSPDGRTLAFDDGQGGVVLWDVSDRAAPRPVGDLPRPVGDLVGYSGTVASMVFSPDGRTLALGGGGGGVVLWDMSDRAAPRRLGDPSVGHTGSVPSVAFSPDGRTLASSGNDHTVVLWDVSDNAAPRRLGDPLAGHNGLVGSVAFSPDGRTLASGSSDQTMILWDVSDRAAPRRLGDPIGYSSLVLSVAFSPDGHTLAASGDDDTVVLWDVSDRAAPPRRLGDPLVHSNSVLSVVFSPDGRTLATTNGDSGVVLWEVSDRAAPRRLGDPLADHTSGSALVGSMVFSRDGRTLAAGALGQAVLWDLTDLQRIRSDLVGEACRRVGGLSEQEWPRYIPDLPFQQVCP